VDTSLVQRISTAPTRQVYVTRTAAGDRNFAGFSNSHHSVFADELLTYQPNRAPAKSLHSPPSPPKLGGSEVQSPPIDSLRHSSKEDYRPKGDSRQRGECNRFDTPQTPSKDEKLFQSWEYLYLGTLILANQTARNSVDQYLQLAHAHDVQCFMDINWRPMFWQDPDEAKAIILERLGLIHYLKVSEDEAHWLLGTGNPKTIRDRYPDLKGLLITLGERGCCYSLGKFSGTVPGFQVNVIDTTGAGDGFVAGCLHQLVNQGIPQEETDAEQWVRYANAVGALTTLQLGAIAPHPTHADVTDFLRNSPV
jgi:sugar/nucleoside kinase (ribokinase family)